MAIPPAKRGRLSQSSDEALSGVVEDGCSKKLTLDGSSSPTEINGHFIAEDQNAILSNGAASAPIGSWERANRSPGQKMRTEQLMALNAAGSSSMTALQVNDLLGEIRPDYQDLMSRVDKSLRRLQSIILDLPDVGPMTAPQAEKSLRKEAGIYIPFPHPRPAKDTRYSFEYKRPARIDVIGSLPLQTGITSKDGSTVDLAITLPDSILQEKDYLNHRYFHKRAYYIAQVAAGIRRKAKNEFRMSFQHQDGIGSKPSLIVEPIDSLPSGFMPSKFRVRIICAVSANVFAANKTLPTKACLRNSADPSPTPYYNACIRSEATVALYHDLLQTTIAQCGAFRDVCRLGRLWLRQRGFGGSLSSGGFGPFEWSILCALLLQSGGSNSRPALSPRYTCLQFFKAVLQFLAARDLTEPIILNGITWEVPRTETPVIFDGAAQINVLFKMTPWSYHLLRQEARSTIGAFSLKVVDSFELIFLKRVDEYLLRFDQCVALEASSLLQNYQEQNDAQECLQKLYAVLFRALGNRARLVHLTYDHSPRWSLDGPLKRDTQAANLILVGLFLNSDHVDRLVDHGPPAEDQTAAADFRKFWGDKAELRRFKDGSITESLVWSEETPVTHQIISYILRHHFDLPSSSVNFLDDQVERLVVPQNSGLRLKSAFKLVNDAFQSLTTQLRHLEGLPLSIRSILPASSQLRYAALPSPFTPPPADPIDIIIEFEGSARWPDSLPAIQRTKIAFLIKLADLFSASDRTIITRVGLENTTGSESEYSNISFLDIIIPSPSPDLLPPIPFRLRIHHDRTLTLLQKALSPNANIPSHNRASLTSTLQFFRRHYLATPNHTAAFSRLGTLYPTLPTAILLLKSWTSSHHLTRSIPAEVLEILAARPYLHPYPYLVPVSAQTAFLRTLNFIASWDWAFEPLIVDFSRKEGEGGGGGGGMDSSALQNLETRFQAWRNQLDPGLNNVIWFVGTNLDETGVVWTQGGRPQKVVAARFTALAKAAIDLIRAKTRVADPDTMMTTTTTTMKTMKQEDWRELFQSPLADFDFLIHLNKMEKILFGHPNGIRAATGPSKFKNLQPHLLRSRYPVTTTTGGGATVEEEGVERIGFDPIALYLQDLDRCFGPEILFFHGGAGAGYGERARGSGGGVIAGLWNPKVLPRKHDDEGVRDWRVKIGYSTIPILGGGGGGNREGRRRRRRDVQEGEGEGEGEGEDDDAAEERVEGLVNQRGMLAEIALLGEGLVERIEVVKGLVG